MTVIAAVPFVLKDVDFKVGTDNYEAHVSEITFTPSTSTVTWQGLTPAAAFSDATTATWVCTMAYAQDWDTVSSLANYLLTNAGTAKVVVFKPSKASGAGHAIFTATLNIVAGPIGGAVNVVQVGSVTCGVVGVPVKTLSV